MAARILKAFDHFVNLNTGYAARKREPLIKNRQFGHCPLLLLVVFLACTNLPCRITSNYGTRSNVLGHNAAGPNNRPVSDSNARHNDA